MSDEGELLDNDNNGELLDGDDGDDNSGELIIVSDDETEIYSGELIDGGEEETTHQYNGVQESIIRGYEVSPTSFTSVSRCFTAIDRGIVTFGDRNQTTGAMTNRHQIYPVYSNGYYGIACTARKMELFSYSASYTNVVLRAGSYVGLTGYLEAITSVTMDPATGGGYLIHWRKERLPFKNGICIATR